MRTGRHIVGVEYDTSATARAIRQRCAQWLVESMRDVPAALGVRSVRTGVLRRPIGVVHHGTPVRYRARDLASAVDALAAMIEGIATEPTEGTVHVDARVLVRDARAVLLVVPPDVDVDDQLRKLSVDDVPCWRAIVDTATREVETAGRRRLPLVGLVVADNVAGSSLDEARHRLWSLGTGDLTGWAELLDDDAGAIAFVQRDDAVAAVAVALN